MFDNIGTNPIKMIHDKTILNSNFIILKGEFTNNDICSPDMNIFKIETNNYCQTCSYSNTTTKTKCAL